jgi:hypothetical protein
MAIFWLAGFSLDARDKPPHAARQVSQKKPVIKKDTPLIRYTGRGDWRAWGTVTNHSKHGQAGLTVELWDKDLMFDDLLGKTRTNRKGQFTIRYQERDFKEMTEVKPDLYIVVRDKRGKPLYSSRQHPRFGAGKSEVFHIILKIKLTPKPIVGKKRLNR